MAINPTFVTNYIEEGQKAIYSLKHFSDTILLKNYNSDHIIRIPIDDFFSKYKDELYDTIELYSVPPKNFFRPKSVSFDIYQTTEMWLALMRLNNFRNITEFDQSIIKIYNPAGLKELINIFFKREKKIT